MSFKTKPTPLGNVEARNVEDATGLKITLEPHKRDNWEKQLAHFWGRGERGEWSMGMCKGYGCHVGWRLNKGVNKTSTHLTSPA